MVRVIILQRLELLNGSKVFSVIGRYKLVIGAKRSMTYVGDGQLWRVGFVCGCDGGDVLDWI